MKKALNKFAFGAAVVGLFLIFNQTIRAQFTLDAFNPSVNGSVYGITMDSSANILIGGNFSAVNGESRTNIARLNFYGPVGSSFAPNVNGTVRAIIPYALGDFIIAGDFTSVNGQTRNRLARVTENGVLNTAFNPNVNDSVLTMTTQFDGRILIGGAFTKIGGVTRTRIARLNGGTLDNTFNADVDGTVYTLATQQPDRKIIIGGTFSNVGGQPRQGIARLNLDGTLDTTFEPPPTGSVFSVVVQTDGKIVIGGYFSLIGGVPRNNIARLNADGSLDTTFRANANLTVWSLALQTDGRILAGGSFSEMNGETRNLFARLNIDGTLDSATTTSVTGGTNSAIYKVLIQPNNQVLLGGNFSAVDGQPRNNLARISPDVGQCGFSISPTSADVPATAGSGTFSVTPTNGTNCSPTAQTSSGWLTVSLAANGSGGGTVTYNFLRNPTLAPRSAEIRAGGQVFTVFQAGGINNGKPFFDYDGDNKTDFAVFRPSNGTWYFLPSQTNNFYAAAFGQNGDQIAPGDYDGDRKTDIAVFRDVTPGAGNFAYFYILNSSNNTFRYEQFGATGDVPMAGDYDGDGKTDVGVYRAATETGVQSNYYYRPTSQPNVNYVTQMLGRLGDRPLLGDFDGDLRTDPGVFRPSTREWFFVTRTGLTGTIYGLGTDIPVPADYDGNGTTDVAVFRPSNGFWYFTNDGSTNFGGIQFGTDGDIPIPADYDGDGKADIAVYRPSNGTWYIRRSTGGLAGAAFGTAEDKPIPGAYIH